MSPPGPDRRATEGPLAPSVAPVAWLLALLALPVGGVLPAGPFPSTPAGYLRVVVGVLAMVLLLGGGGTSRRRRRVDAVVLLVALAPFVAFGLLELPRSGGPSPVPLGLFVAAVVAVLAGGGGAPTRGVGPSVGPFVVTLLAAAALLGAGGVAVLPAAWNPFTASGAGVTTSVDGAQRALARSPLREEAGLRAGAPRLVTEVPPLARGAGPWLSPVTEGTLPERGPVVLVLDGRAGAVRTEADGTTIVPATLAPTEHPLELDAFDAMIVLPGAWGDADPAARARADAVSTFVRRGGLLVGPGPEVAWPEALGRRLGAAGHSDVSGAEGARTLGLGRVARARSEAEARAILAEGLWVPRMWTSFDRARAAPAAPRDLPAWRDEPAGRRAGAILLLAYALLLAAFDRSRAGTLGRVAGLVAPAAAVVAGLVLSSPHDPGVRAEGILLDLGGAGARRVEAVYLSAGPGGYRGRVAWEGGGVVRLLGGEVEADGRVALAAGGAAWAVRELPATGNPSEGDRAEPAAEFLWDLVGGRGVGGSTHLGRGFVLPVHVEGVGPVTAWSLIHRP